MDSSTLLPIIMYSLLLAILISTLGFTVFYNNHGFYVWINDKRYYSMVIIKYNRLFNLKGFINLITQYKDDAEVHLYTRPVKEYSLAAGAEEEYQELQVVITIPFRNSKEYRNFIKKARLEGIGAILEPCNITYGTDYTAKTNLHYCTVLTSLIIAYVKECAENNVTCYLTEENSYEEQ